MDEQSVVLVKDAIPELDDADMEEAVHAIARMINVDNLHTPRRWCVCVWVTALRWISCTRLPKSYQEAKMALEVGHVFYAEYGDDLICET